MMKQIVYIRPGQRPGTQNDQAIKDSWESSERFKTRWFRGKKFETSKNNLKMNLTSSFEIVADRLSVQDIWENKVHSHNRQPLSSKSRSSSINLKIFRLRYF